MENDMGHGTSRFLKASIAAALLIGMVGAGAVFAATKPSAHAASAAIRRAVRVSAGSAAARKLAHGGSLPAEMVQLTDITAHTKRAHIHKPKRHLKGRNAKSRAAAVKAAVSANAGPAGSTPPSAKSDAVKFDAGKSITAPVEARAFSGLEDNEIESDPLNLGFDLSADTEGAAGPKYYGESVGFAVGFFDKASGALVSGEEDDEFFEGSGIGAPCEKDSTEGYAEPHILYDPTSDRWIVMVTAEQNAFEVGSSFECIGVSATGDPVAGEWHYYSVPLFTEGAETISNGAVGMWTNGVYMSEEIYCKSKTVAKCPAGYNKEEEFVGTQVWAFNRTDLESGAPLEIVTTQGEGVKAGDNFEGPNTEVTFSNKDAEGPVPANIEPQTGTPPDSSEASKRNEYFLSSSDLPGTFLKKSDGLLDVWQWHVNWENPSEDWIGKSKSAQVDYQVTTPIYAIPNSVAVKAPEVEYTIPTAGPTAYANPLATAFDGVLPKPQYTDFGGKESLWLGKATSAILTEKSGEVKTEGPDRVRWEQIALESSSGAPKTSAPEQTQDYAPEPTALSRWLPAIGVDKEGDMTLGYSGTDTSVYPSLYIAGQEKVEGTAEGTAKIESLPETVVDEGHGYQTGAEEGEIDESFGPQNSVSVDPNGCEFWFAGQVDVGSPTNPEGEDDAWATQITSYHFADCKASTLATAVSVSGEGNASTGTATLSAKLTASGTHSGLFGERVVFSLGGKTVGTATTNEEGIATLTGVDSSGYAAGVSSGAVSASYAGASAYDYAGSQATGSLLVGATQTISFGALAGRTYGEGPFAVSASASSGEPVTFTASGTCTVSGAEVTITGAGACTITASQPGNGSSLIAAPSVSQTFDIARETQTITPTGTWTSNETVGVNFEASATASSGLLCTEQNGADCVYFYVPKGESHCSEVENGKTPQAEFKPVDAPSCTIDAEQDGNQNVAPVIQSITVGIPNKGTQKGTFAETKMSYTLTELAEGISNPVTWPSEEPTTSTVVTGSTSLGALAAASTATLGGEKSGSEWEKVTDSTTEEATCKSPTAGTATVTFKSSKGSVDGFQPGDLVKIEGSKVAAYNTTSTEVKTTPTTNSFTYCVTKTKEAEEKSSKAVTVTGVASTTVSGTTASARVMAAPTTKLEVGQKVNIAGVKSTSEAEYNNKTVEILSVPTTTSFTYKVKSGTANGLGGTVGLPNTGAVDNEGVATIKLATEPATTLTPGGSITIEGVTEARYDGTFEIISVPSATSFTYKLSEPAVASGAGSITSPAAPCTYNSAGVLTAQHAGTCKIEAKQAGNASYNEATAAQTLTITGGTQALAWSPSGGNISSSKATEVSATTNSGLSPGIITSTTTSICTVGATTEPVKGSASVTVTPVAEGTCTLSASGNVGSPEWAELKATKESFTVTNAGAAQTITFAEPKPTTLIHSPLTLSPTASSGLPVTLMSTTESVCTTGGSHGHTVTLLTEGSCALVAEQPGEAGVWAAATSVTRSFRAAKGDQLLAFAQLPNREYGTSDFALKGTSAEAISENAYSEELVTNGVPTGLPVSYEASGACTVNSEGTDVHLTGTGVCSILAKQAGNSIYREAPSVAVEFKVLAVPSAIVFANPGSQTYGEPAFTPGASATSGLAVTYTASGACSVTGEGLVQVGTPGECTVTAHGVGGSDYLPPARVSQTFTVGKASQSIEFAVAEHHYGEADFTISATATSGEPVSFKRQSGECTVSGSTVHITGTGTCTIVASQAGNADYEAAPAVSETFSIDAASQTITFPSIPDQSYGGEPVALEASASSGLPVSYTAAGPCSISGATVVTEGVGSCEVTASQEGDSDYDAASSVTRTFSIGGGSQTITFANPGTRAYGSADFNPDATASSRLQVTYTASGVCSITEAGLVHLIEAGSCTVTAHQEGSALWEPATPVERTFTVQAESQTITFASPGTQTYGEEPFTPVATASSGLPVMFEASEDCTIEDGSLVLTGAGSCTVTALQSGDSQYIQAPPVSRKFTVEKAAQTIDFSVAEHTYGDPDFTISASATSGEPVSFSRQSGECTVSEDTVHITGSGSCTIDATQAGNANYGAAPEVQETFRIDAASQTITFPTIANKTYGEANFSPEASASSGLPVSYSALGDCTIEAGKVHITGVGSCTVKAKQAGDEDYEPASEVEQSFTIAKGTETITFNPPASVSYGAAPFKLSASASTGLPVTFSGSGPCTVTAAGEVTITGVGSCTVTVTQSGNADYEAAAPVSKSITIEPMETSVSLTPKSKTVKSGKTVRLTAKVSAAEAGYQLTSGTVAFYVNGELVDSQTLGKGATSTYVYAVKLPASATGYPVKAVYASENVDIAGSTSATSTLKVRAAKKH
jgi:hypothetical protein